MLDLGTVLVVDDDDDIVQWVALTLRGLGYQVRTAASAEQAFDQLERGRLDLIITDINMPGASGIDLVQTIREANLDVVVLVMSAQPSIAKAVEAIRAGARNYIEKPIDPARLKAEVRDVFRERKTVRPAASDGEIGRYRIVERIGKGSMGTVFRAIDPALQRTLAIKTFDLAVGDEHLIERFFREARAAASVASEHRRDPRSRPPRP